MDLFNIFIADTTWDFALEIIIRCIVMYLLIIIFLRLTGKKRDTPTFRFLKLPLSYR